MPATDLIDELTRCARLIENADGVLITAGAGLGVDSGLPDFRGDAGLWRTYPALGRAGMHFQDIACPDAFYTEPRLAWGFYGHRLKLYRETAPGASFRILDGIARRLPAGAFVFTSNVDGHFQQAGYDPARIVECHGSIHHLQCLGGCGDDIWSADGFVPVVDEVNCRLLGDFPRCPWCGGTARPNILMFGDGGWCDERTRLQQARLVAWCRKLDRLVVIEIGAGTAIPSVRQFGESQDCPLIRINLREAGRSLRHRVALPMRGLDALSGIAAALEARHLDA